MLQVQLSAQYGDRDLVLRGEAHPHAKVGRQLTIITTYTISNMSCPSLYTEYMKINKTSLIYSKVNFSVSKSQL